jgi:hypothetical protein
MTVRSSASERRLLSRAAWEVRCRDRPGVGNAAAERHRRLRVSFRSLPKASYGRHPSALSPRFGTPPRFLFGKWNKNRNHRKKLLTFPIIGLERGDGHIGHHTHTDRTESAAKQNRPRHFRAGSAIACRRQAEQVENASLEASDCPRQTFPQFLPPLAIGIRQDHSLPASAPSAH